MPEPIHRKARFRHHPVIPETNMNFAATTQPRPHLVFAICPLVCLLAICGTQLFFVSPAWAQPTPSVEPDQSDAGVDFSEWIVMRPTGAEAEFKAPCKPRYVERSFSPVQDQPPIKVRLYQALIKERNEMYIFGYHDLHFAPTGKKKINETLDGAVRGSFANVSGKMTGHAKIRYGKYPGRAYVYLYSFKDKIYKVSARVFLVDERQFQLSTIMPQDSFDDEMAKKFLESFRIVKPDSDLPPRPPVPPKENIYQSPGKP